MFIMYIVSVMIFVHISSAAADRYSFIGSLPDTISISSSNILQDNETTSNSSLQNTTLLNLTGQIGNNISDTFDILLNNETVNSPKHDVNASSDIIPKNHTCPICTCGKSNRRKRIVGGEPTGQNEFPWMVALSLSWGVCCSGAILITKQHLLTAAHCTYGFNARDIKASLGRYDLRKKGPYEITIDIEKIIQHPKYNDSNLKNDIAILKLARPITFITSHIQPACLIKSENQNYTGLIAIATGWGSLSKFESNSTMPNLLHKVELPMMSDENCAKKYDDIDDIICTEKTGQKGVCHGDSGGPLHISDTMEVVGITSGGPACVDYHAFYTRISTFMRWIKENIDGECLC